MISKIILFLSTYNSSSAQVSYTCPDGASVPGAQTNDAPVRYLLKAHPGVRKIICVVTTQARETAWEHFRGVVSEGVPEAEVIPVPYEEDEDFSEKAIPEILKHTQPGDEIFLDVTGGFRNANMYLLLLSRVLSYKGIRTAGAVYSNFRTAAVEDISPLIELFDLVGGMQELTAFGNVRTLRAYYGRQAARDEKTAALLACMERLTETITLCRTGQIEEQLNRFNTALAQAEDCGDPLMRTLLPVFQEKFGRKLTTPGLIKWCVENGMVQQALTIYKERIPAYLLRERGDIIERAPDSPAPENVKSYESEDEAWFNEYLLSKVDSLDDGSRYTGFRLKCSAGALRTILTDYLYIRALRNMIHHANDISVEPARSRRRFEAAGYKRPEEAGLDDVKNALRRGLENLKLSAGRRERK